MVRVYARTDRLPAVGLLVVLLLPILFAAPGVSGTGETSRNGRPIAPTSGVLFAEVVTYEHSDWNGNGHITETDEYVVVRNFGATAVDVGGWVLRMVDTTPEQITLTGLLAPGEARVLLNPPGRMNNDVTLVLLDAAGTTVDEVTLGRDGVPLGRGDSVLDEAVHLAGPWAGLRGPGTLGRGLAPVFVSRIIPAFLLDTDLPIPAPFDSPWLAPQARVAVEVRAAAGAAVDVTQIVVAGVAITAERRSGTDWWLTPPVPFAGQTADAAVVVRTTLHEVTHHPNGAALAVRVDASPPRLVPVPGTPQSYGIMDGSGRVHALPTVTAGPSGLATLGVTVGGAALPACLPLAQPAPDCVVDPGTGEVQVLATTGAGHEEAFIVPLARWDTPPSVPAIGFLAGPPPRLAWATGERVLAHIVVEHADEGGEPVTLATLPGNATEAVDLLWGPGAERSYRLRVTDLAGNAATGAWVPLDPAAVPVQLDFDPRAAGDALARDRHADIVFTSDRALAELPRLVFESTRPQPYSVATNLTRTEDPLIFKAMVALPAAIPREASGSWRFEQGLGIDGAPVAPRVRAGDFDGEAPRVVVEGAGEEWLRKTQQVVRLRATDGVDAAPVLTLGPLPAGATTQREDATHVVTFSGEGIHTLTGTAADAAGNERVFSLRVRLDATPPVVHESKRPQVWSSEEPLVVHITDATSGVDPASLSVTISDANGSAHGVVARWENDTVVEIVPEGEIVAAPYEVYLFVADHAGNVASGRLDGALHAAPLPGGAAAPLDGGGARLPPPSFLGRPWDGDASGSAGAGDAAGEGSAGVWDALAARGAPPSEKTGSVAWLLFGLAGTIGLGTVVHRARRTRRRRPTGAQAAAVRPDAVAAVMADGAEVTWSHEHAPPADCHCGSASALCSSAPAAHSFIVHAHIVPDLYAA